VIAPQQTQLSTYLQHIDDNVKSISVTTDYPQEKESHIVTPNKCGPDISSKDIQID
jgi:hypothetical protein